MLGLIADVSRERRCGVGNLTSHGISQRKLLLIVDIFVGIRNAIKVYVWVVTFVGPHLRPR